MHTFHAPEAYVLVKLIYFYTPRDQEMVGKPVGNDARNVRAPRGGTAILSEVFSPPALYD